ncbi:cytochrome P450, partial [Elsinoe ampelina]
LSLLHTHRLALALSLPLIHAPITWQSPLQPLLHPLLSPIFTPLSRLPYPFSLLGKWYHFSPLAWPFLDRRKAHDALGPAMAIVSPHKLEIIIADPGAVRDVLKGWREWEKPADVYALFDVFGRNVNTVNGAEWMRHRKVGAVGFRKGNCGVVWREGRRQVGGMVGWFGEGGDGQGAKERTDVDLERLREGVSLLAMHVLMAAGFGREYAFGGKGLDKKEEGFEMSYGGALQYLLRNMMMTILFSAIKVPGWMLPASLRKLKLARGEFQRHLELRIEEEREAFRREEKEGKSRLGDTLAASLVRANELAKKEDGGKFVLSDDELYGNFFLYNLAGFETTSTQLAYTIPLLAVYPEIQAWVREEVDLVMAEGGDYAEMYPKLVRTLALLYETLRLIGSAQQLPRTTGSQSRNLTIAGRTLSIPPDTLVSINFPAIHLDESVWGKDAHLWKPKRWVASTPTSEIKNSSKTMDGSGPDGMSFIAWVAGPRVCPGKKFSQVEFVSVIFSLLSEYTIEVGAKMYEGLEGTVGQHWDEVARGRLLDVVMDGTFDLAPKVKHPTRGEVR